MPGCHGGTTMDDYFGVQDVRRCLHESGYDCDRLFHYCKLCSVPLDDCGCVRN
ncbi:MAG: hypothetical protein ACE5HJ_09360 [Thermoplasmata archaeon]